MDLGFHNVPPVFNNHVRYVIQWRSSGEDEPCCFVLRKVLVEAQMPVLTIRSAAQPYLQQRRTSSRYLVT